MYCQKQVSKALVYNTLDSALLCALPSTYVVNRILPTYQIELLHLPWLRPSSILLILPPLEMGVPSLIFMLWHCLFGLLPQKHYA